MVPSVEQQLVTALTETSTASSRPRQYEVVEDLVVELLEAQRRAAREGIQLDALIPRGNEDPVVIEIKLIVGSGFQRNFHNRLSDLLATAVRAGRAFRGEVVLSAVLLIAGDESNTRFHKQNELAATFAQRLLRAEDGVGYDSILFGYADTQMQWRYFTTDESGGVLTLSPATSEVVELIRRQKPAVQRKSTVQVKHRRQRFLLVADEWKSGRGGLSTLNRELATALASSNVDVAVMVPQTSEGDLKAASNVRVSLVTPARIPGLSDRETLMLRPIFADRSWEPDVIVGHGRVLGPYAACQQSQFFPRARRVHFVHADAEQLEAAKEAPGGESRMSSAASRRNLERDLARSSDLVVGVGPLLAGTIRDDLIGLPATPKVSCLIPGLRNGLDASCIDPPIRNHILVLGRADDFHSKGIDIAAEAILRVASRWPGSRSHRPVLVIRGVPDELATVVKGQLDEILEGQVAYHLRPYSDSESELIQDLAQARALLMPSRHEGFGLVALEAIGIGVPVIISAESGLAQFLRESGIDTDPSSIITTRNSSSEVALDRWAESVQRIIDLPDIARAQAVALRRKISAVVSWEKSAASLLEDLDMSS